MMTDYQAQRLGKRIADALNLKFSNNDMTVQTLRGPKKPQGLGRMVHEIVWEDALARQKEDPT